MNRAISIRLVITVMAFCLPWIPNPASAQQEKGKESTTTEQKPAVAYRIEFNVREVEDGKRLNSRNYMIVAQDDDWGRIRVEDKFPYQAGENPLQHADVRMSIDCRPHQRGESVALSIIVDFSSMTPPEAAPKAPPVFRTDRTEVEPVLTYGKPTLVASMDDTTSNRRYEIEVTATKVK